MFQVYKCDGQTVTLTTSVNEFHVTQIKDGDRSIVYHFHYKEHEIVDALAKYDDLVLALRIEYTLKKRKQDGSKNHYTK